MNMSDCVNVKQSVHAERNTSLEGFFLSKRGEKQTFLVNAEGDSCKKGSVLDKCKQREFL